MPVSMDVKVNTRQMTGKLVRLDAEFEALIRSFLEEVGMTVETKAKQLYEKRSSRKPDALRTGKLGSSFKHEVDGRNVFVTFGGEESPQRFWWEWGGSTHSPRGNTDRPMPKGGRTVFPAWRSVKKGLTARAEAELKAIGAVE